MSKSLKTFIDDMNNNLEASAARTEAKRFKKMKGSSVVIEHGMYDDVPPPPEPEKAVKYKGTPMFATSGKHSLKKDGLNEKVQIETHPEEMRHFGDWNQQNDNAHLGPHDLSIEHAIHEQMPFHKKPTWMQKAHKEYSEYSQDLNHHLHDSYNKGVHPGTRTIQHNIKDLDETMNHHALKKDLHVYSGVGFHPGHEAIKNPEGKLHLAAFTSSSISKQVAKNFARKMDDKGKKIENDDASKSPIIHKHIIHFHLKPGQKGSFIGSHSEMPKEKEFTIPRSTTIKIHPKPDSYKSIEGNNQHHQTHVWHAHVVPNEEER